MGDQPARPFPDDRAKKNVELYDHMGRPMKEKPPTPLTASYCRKVYYKGLARVGEYDDQGKRGDPIREELVRAQVPYCIHLVIYESKFQIEPTLREYFAYAPLDVQHGAELAVRLWRRWEKRQQRTTVFGESFNFNDMEDDYPKVGEGVAAKPMSDSEFDEHWKDVRKRHHKAAGHPDDPFAFTCLDPDVMLFKHTDFLEGHAVKPS